MAVLPGDVVAAGDLLMTLHLNAGQTLPIEAELDAIFGFDDPSGAPPSALLLERLLPQ